MAPLRFRAWWTGLEKMTTDFSIAADGTVYSRAGNKLFDGEIVVMQSTGLKDKNGQEIFEDDILKDGKGQHGLVFWHRASFRIEWQIRGYNGERPVEEVDSCFEYGTVVGNIHENSDLLK